jgi:hypothetical protein
MALVTFRVELHVAVPAGIATVSPLAAEAMAARTSAREGLAASKVVACAVLEVAKSSAARTEFRIA